MARGRGRRSANVTPSRRLHVSPSPNRVFHRDSPVVLRRRAYSNRFEVVPRRPDIADNRFWHPLGVQRAVTTYGGTVAAIKRLYDAPRSVRGAIYRYTGVPAAKKKVARAVQKRIAQINRFGPSVYRATRAIRAFSDPLSVPLCHARKVRREVMHALGIAGSGVGRPRYKNESAIRC